MSGKLLEFIAYATNSNIRLYTLNRSGMYILTSSFNSRGKDRIRIGVVHLGSEGMSAPSSAPGLTSNHFIGFVNSAPDDKRLMTKVNGRWKASDRRGNPIPRATTPRRTGTSGAPASLFNSFSSRPSNHSTPQSTPRPSPMLTSSHAPFTALSADVARGLLRRLTATPPSSRTTPTTLGSAAHSGPTKRPRSPSLVTISKSPRVGSLSSPTHSLPFPTTHFSQSTPRRYSPTASGVALHRVGSVQALPPHPAIPMVVRRLPPPPYENVRHRAAPSPTAASALIRNSVTPPTQNPAPRS